MNLYNACSRNVADKRIDSIFTLCSKFIITQYILFGKDFNAPITKKLKEAFNKRG
jgi:hypothetical protein